MPVWLKRTLVALGVVALVGAAGAYGFYEAMKRAWVRYGEYDIRTEGTLKVGDLAPDLVLSTLDGAASVRLSDAYRVRPVLLAFGSYT